MQNCFCFRPNPRNKHFRDREDIEDRVYLSILLKKKKKKKSKKEWTYPVFCVLPVPGCCKSLIYIERPVFGKKYKNSRSVGPPDRGHGGLKFWGVVFKQHPLTAKKEGYSTLWDSISQCGTHRLCPYCLCCTAPMHQCGAGICPHYDAPMWCGVLRCNMADWWRGV